MSSPFLLHLPYLFLPIGLVAAVEEVILKFATQYIEEHGARGQK